MVTKPRSFLFAAIALVLAAALPAGTAEAAGGGGGHGGGISLGLGGGGGISLGGGAGHGGGMSLGGAIGGHGGMAFGGGAFGGAGNSGMHLGGRALGGTSSLGVGGLGLRGPTLQASPPSGSVSLVSPEVAKFDARMGLKLGSTGVAFDQFAADRTSKADEGGKNANVKHDRILTAVEIEQEELQLEQSQQLTPTASPLSAASLAELTTSETPPPVPAETIQTTPDTMTSPFSESSIGAINAFFAGHAATVPSVPTSSVSVSIGGTVPNGVALFPLPVDLQNQLPDGNFAYFFWGNNVVVADSETNVVQAIIPDVLKTAPLED